MKTTVSTKGVSFSGLPVKSKIFESILHENRISNLSSKEIDREFWNDMQTLSRIMRSLPADDRKKFIGAIKALIEHYFEHKVGKSIEESLFKIMKW